MDRIQTELFDQTADGQSVYLYTLTNANDVTVKIISYGGIIQSLTTPDRQGNIDDVVLGYDSLADYEACKRYLGCITGRYANRIANSCFTLDGVSYALEKNLGEHHLHSASAGLNKVVWEGVASDDSSSASVVLSYVSADGHGGYPGRLVLDVRYTLNDAGELRIGYRASTDKATVLNLTNHSYFNLRGHQYAGRDGVLDHTLQLSAEEFIPSNNQGIPLGVYHKVAATPMDFRKPHRIGERISDDHPQLQAGHGYDHTWVPASPRSASDWVAVVHEPVSGRTMRVGTSQPGVHFYSANHVTEITGKSGVAYRKRGSLCLETQHPADSPNQPAFPSTVLRPGQLWEEETIYQFDVK
ncbi:hypothetical protein AB833_19810 [Chromatiales bacterium (ex Bugula neritina AB1)]|nr:hypothetical protein AB833_19810 [Chromatiales bacterium (ex Bugula neritina AB1)]